MSQKWLVDIKQKLQSIYIKTFLVFQILCTLSFLATGSYQKIISSNVETYISQSSASRAIHQVVDALNNSEIIRKYIRFPQNANERQSLKER